MDDILKLKEMLDVDTFAPVAKQLQQKAWLMHWSLFVFFNHENGLNALIDLFMQDRWAPGGWAAVHSGQRLWAVMHACVHSMRSSRAQAVVAGHPPRLQVPDRHPAHLAAPAALPGGGSGCEQAAAQRAERPQAGGQPGGVRVHVSACGWVVPAACCCWVATLCW